MIIKKDILVFDKDPAQKLDDTTIRVEPKYSNNFPRSKRKLWLSQDYNESNSLLFVNAIKIYQFKVKGSGLKKCSLPIGHRECFKKIGS